MEGNDGRRRDAAKADSAMMEMHSSFGSGVEETELRWTEDDRFKEEMKRK